MSATPSSGPALAPLRAVVGTAGHIDHGKSALVRALTGIETDRLPEEKERGISIELGFAHLDLAGVGRVGVVDVPGHERFLRQMLAGACGFDLVLVVVAADDGVMPQTEEHFDIVHLLGVERAVFVVTKTDAATPARVDDVRGEIEILAAGTRFEDAPVVAVSARRGDGVDELRARIAEALSGLPRKDEDGPLRVPVDRAFVVKGHGVVVTGTAIGGRVSVGDEVRLVPERPSPRVARVREIQVHGASVPSASAGQRVALNLAGLAREDVARGDTVTVAAAGSPTSRFDARVEIRPGAGRPLPSHARVRVHHGTSETAARLVWLDGREEVAPKSAAYAQLALAEPLLVLAGDRFVIRDETAERTLGGGVVLLAHAEKHRRSHGDVTPALGELEHGDEGTRLATALAMASAPALDPAEAAAAVGLRPGRLAALLAEGDRVVALPDASAPQMLFAASRLAAATDATVAAVVAFQREHPNLPGVDLEHLRGVVRPAFDAKPFRLVVERAIASGLLVRRGNLVHTPGHAASLGGADDALASRLLARLAEAGAMPPTVKELADEWKVDAARVTKVAAVLVLRGDVVRVTPELYFATSATESLRARLVEHLEREGEITAGAFRDLVSASRKYCIPLLDWFDRTGLTIRVGDARRLRKA